MLYDSKDMIRSAVIPVLLGGTPTAHLLAFKIYWKYGIVSYICDTEKRIADRLDPFSKFFSLVSSDSEVIRQVLEYLSSNHDYLPIIIPCDKYYDNFISKNKDFLEQRFIISDRTAFFTQKPMSSL